MLPVAVEIAPPSAPREHAAALLAACSRAVAESECVPAEEAPQGGTQAVAIVTWHGDERVVVEVGLRAEGKPIWRSRNLSFNPDDAVVERWRTVGYVVGTLARDERPADEPVAPAQPEAKKPPPPVAQPKPPAPADEGPKPLPSPKRPVVGPARAALDVGAVVGPAWSGLRSGGIVRTRWPLQNPLRVLASVRYLERGADELGLSGQWLTVGAGIGAVLGTAEAEVSAALDLRGEYFHARAEDAQGRVDTQGGVLPGIGFGLTGAWMPTTMLGVYAGGDLELMFSHTPLEVAGQVVAVDGPLRLSADAGVRLRLW